MSTHVLPVDDLIEHERTDDCPCGVKTVPVTRDDGSISWLYVHASLDGRELRESADAGQSEGEREGAQAGGEQAPAADRLDGEQHHGDEQ